MTEAGAAGRPYIAAWQAVINIMELKPGETTLITGGAGLVGQAATAIAHRRGAKPIVADRRKAEGVEDFIERAEPGRPARESVGPGEDRGISPIGPDQGVVLPKPDKGLDSPAGGGSRLAM